jgi:SAM-dependent methyltransferase
MKGRKRSLSQTGGACQLDGDPDLARRLADCLRVDACADVPFTHGFHSYPARMHPETASRALDAFAAPRIFDPFVGSGTTALEAVRRGMRFTGCDVSNVALEIAWARTRVLPIEDCRRLESAGHRIAGRGLAEQDRFIDFPDWARAEREWYSPHTLREVCLLKSLIEGEREETVRRLLVTVLSSVVVRLSRQASDSVARPDRDFRPRPRGAAFRAFRDRVRELAGMLRSLGSDLRGRGVRFVAPDLRKADSRGEVLPPLSADLVLTSPPYAGTYDYARHQARRYPLFGGGEDFVRGHEIGARREAGRGYREDMEAAFRQMVRALVPGGHILLLLGDGTVEGKPLAADRLIGDLAARTGARVLASASQTRRDWSGGPTRREHLILARKDV